LSSLTSFFILLANTGDAVDASEPGQILGMHKTLVSADGSVSALSRDPSPSAKHTNCPSACFPISEEPSGIGLVTAATLKHFVERLRPVFNEGRPYVERCFLAARPGTKKHVSGAP
jgi:hypothetical protein